MAVRVGFEPTEAVRPQRFSRPPDSTTLAPHLIFLLYRMPGSRILRFPICVSSIVGSVTTRKTLPEPSQRGSSNCNQPPPPSSAGPNQPPNDNCPGIKGRNQAPESGAAIREMTAVNWPRMCRALDTPLLLWHRTAQAADH